MSSRKNLTGTRPKELLNSYSWKKCIRNMRFIPRSRSDNEKRPFLSRCRNGARLGTFYNRHPPGILRTRYLTGTIWRTLCVLRKVLLSVRGIVSLALAILHTRKAMIYATAHLGVPLERQVIFKGCREKQDFLLILLNWYANRVKFLLRHFTSVSESK